MVLGYTVALRTHSPLSIKIYEVQSGYFHKIMDPTSAGSLRTRGKVPVSERTRLSQGYPERGFVYIC